MDEIGYNICRTQGEIYERMANNGYDIRIFSEHYLRSDFCRRAFDTIYSRFQYADDLECLDFILPEIGDKCRKTKDFLLSADIAYWIGFTYRQLYVETNIPSSELVEKIPFDVMLRYYPGLHTVDENMATDIICENFQIKKIS